MKREAFKIDERLLKLVRKLKQEDGREITWHIERAVRNYLIAKKMEV